MAFILLERIDAKWKDHLYSLDTLKDGIGLRAYGQRDPLKEYQKEAFDMFEAMIASIKEEVVELIFRVQTVREEKKPRVLASARAEYLHPTSQGMAAAGVSSAPSPEHTHRHSLPAGAIPRHGGKEGAMRAAESAETVRRPGPKVGRNDPCPCASGKKYKKCHGAHES